MALEQFLKSLNIRPRDWSFYLQAFTHSTYSNEQTIEISSSYERLEFLGDALLAFAVSRFLFEQYPLDEGKMSVIRAAFVKKEALAQYTQKLGLHKHLKIGHGANELLENTSVQADLFESFLAAVFLDQGFNKVNTILNQTIYPDIRKSWYKENKDSKTLLQEFLQAESRSQIVYKTIKEKEFYISKISFEGMLFGSGKGKTKKQAEIEAAQKALLLLKENQ